MESGVAVLYCITVQQLLSMVLLFLQVAPPSPSPFQASVQSAPLVPFSLKTMREARSREQGIRSDGEAKRGDETIVCARPVVEVPRVGVVVDSLVFGPQALPLSLIFSIPSFLPPSPSFLNLRCQVWDL